MPAKPRERANKNERNLFTYSLKWTPRTMFLITLLSSSQFYPESLSSPEMSHNHDVFLWLNLISDGRKIPQCSGLFIVAYIHLVKSWRHVGLHFCSHAQQAARSAKCQPYKDKRREVVWKQLKVVCCRL